MTGDIIEPLTQDERTVLTLADEGAPMLAIGRWKDTTLSLYARGYLHQHTTPGGGAEYRITYYGKKALGKFENAEAAEGERVAKTIEDIQSEIRGGISRAVEFFVQAARQSSIATGDSPETALRKWIKILADESLKRLAQ